MSDLNVVDLVEAPVSLEEIRAELRDAGEPFCVVCGCTQSCGCEGGCIWVTPNLCSRCV